MNREAFGFMKRRLIWTLALALAVPFGATGREKPNVVVIVADDLGYAELGCYGNEQIPTPHIDSIAKNGVRFTDGYVTGPFCSTSRAGLMSGRYQTRFGYEFNPIGHHNEDPAVGIPHDETLLPEHLLEAGYVSALIGKWHLGGSAAFHPHRHGFDEFFGFTHEGRYFRPRPYEGMVTWERRRVLPGGGKGLWKSEDGLTYYTTHMGHNEPDYDANNPVVHDGQPVYEEANLTDAFTREAKSVIERSADRPFFLYLTYNAVHSPLQAELGYLERFESIEDPQRRIFAAMLAHLDDGVGEVLSTLREQELEEKTIVFFLSDNGGPTRELTSSNLPLRDGKGHLYDGGIRVPFLMQWTGPLRGGQVYERPVISLDIYATVASAAGRPVRAGQSDGVNLLPYLKGEVDEDPHEALFWRQNHRRALRAGDWKLVSESRGDQPDWELYDLANDIGETQDLAAMNPEKLQQLIAMWEERNAEMIEPAWRPQRYK